MDDRRCEEGGVSSRQPKHTKGAVRHKRECFLINQADYFEKRSESHLLDTNDPLRPNS